MKAPMVFLSKYNWESGMKGSKIAFTVGEKAIYRGKNGKAYDVIVRSELKSHKDAPNGQFIRELEFLNGPEGHGIFAVPADQMEPVFD